MIFNTWKDELKFLYFEDKRKKYPTQFILKNGAYIPRQNGMFEGYLPKPFTDRTTNGLTNCVKSFLEWSGHYCIRTGRQGQARVERIPIGGTQQSITGKGVKYGGKISFTKNPEEKAFADLHASIEGLFIAIEIKCRTTKDRLKDDQKKNKIHVESSKGIHLVVPDMETFWLWYHNELPIILKSKLK